MCQGCWEGYGSPKVLSAKAEAAVPLIKAVYDQPRGGAGGNLHIVLDDWNLGDESVQWCIDNTEMTDIERACAEHLQTMTLEERAAALAKYEEFIP